HTHTHTHTHTSHRQPKKAPEKTTTGGTLWDGSKRVTLLPRLPLISNCACLHRYKDQSEATSKTDGGEQEVRETEGERERERERKGEREREGEIERERERERKSFSSL